MYLLSPIHVRLDSAITEIVTTFFCLGAVIGAPPFRNDFCPVISKEMTSGLTVGCNDEVYDKKDSILI